ncbi:PTS fructose transporter subunit IIB [Bacillus sp. AFS073361]|uniref:PTS fructose-like transporter subunit IIB n=1 Tax=Bacillus sp. AFS073361 TaxID=2033511 RepID=UPI000BF25EC4|nr:PTS fructose-like transporter subunit IIB [Bacillus sp. AFS073361]PFP15650.1 PTS fructose transporter subunit IIB [Bacillus sp. AFS073361]
MKILGVTACPSGVAHTYMAAEALSKAAKKRGHSIKVETQGSIGIENTIRAEEVVDADIIILTKDMAIKNKERFAGKPIINVGVGDVVRKADIIVAKAEEVIAQRVQK